MVEIAVGEKVSGSYWKKDDGSLEAKNVKVGAHGGGSGAQDQRAAEGRPRDGSFSQPVGR